MTRGVHMSTDEARDETERSVVMMCGIAGSGKTTHARALEQRGHVRLSIEEAIWARTSSNPYPTRSCTRAPGLPHDD